MSRVGREQGRLIVGVIVVGAAAGAFAIAFRSAIAWLYLALYHHDNVVDAIAGLPGWLRLMAPVVGAFGAGLIARIWVGRAQNVSNVMEAVALGRVELSFRTTAARAAASWTAIAGGVSIGREGPLIEVGGALGAAVGRLVQAGSAHTRVLIAVGTAAGFGAAYNTPFAATLFVLETIAGVAAPVLVLPVMGGTIIGVAVTRAFVGPGPIYGQRAFGLASATELAAAAMLGVVAALVAIAFKRMLALFECLFEQQSMRQPLRATIGGLVVGVIAIGLPAVGGNGYEPLNRLLDAPVGVGMLALLAVAKVIATSASVGAGIPGGIFTPMLLVGAVLGIGWSEGLAWLHIAPLNPGGFALVGMAATTAASIHAPLTAAVMIFELSGDYAVALPLLLATMVSTTLSRMLGSESIYETELRKRGLAWDLTLEGRQLRDNGQRDAAPARAAPGDSP
jgi:CIC family chloride channel protein